MGNFEVLASSFGQVSAAYDRVRPQWPAESLDVLGLPVTATVTEVGAGTGRLTQLLTSRFRSVMAIEPFAATPAHASMAGAHLLRGVAEALPVRDSSVDAIFAAEAFHWFDQRRAAAEFARVLRPGGLAVLMWNRRAAPITPEPQSAAWNEIERLFTSADHPLTAYKSRPWIAAFDGRGMGTFRTASINHTQLLTREEFPVYASTLSWVATQPDARRESLIRQLTHDLAAPEYHLHWRTDIHWAVRTSCAARRR